MNSRLPAPCFATFVAVLIATSVLAFGETIPNSTLQPSVWLDASSLTLQDGDAVSSWDDRSGNLRGAVQGTTARRPVFHTGVANGLPVVRFNSEPQPGGISNQFLAFPGILANDPTSILSLFVVAFDTGGRTSVNGRATLLNTRTNAAVTNGFLFGYGTSPTIADYAQVGRTISSGGSGNLQFAGLGESDFNLLTLTRDGLNTTLGAFTDVDATANTATWSGFTPSTLPNTTQIGTEGGQHYLFGDIAEIIAFEGVTLNPEEQDQVVRYLGQKYNIAFASPVPEPSSVLLGSAAGAGLLLRRRRR